MKDLRVLIACEESQAICKEFRALGFTAFSCDLLPCSGGHEEWHIQDDVSKHLEGWDLIIAHPVCQYLAVSGARWMYNKDGSINQDRKEKQEKALDFVRMFMDAPCEHICIENPISIISSRIRKPDQIIEPWMFGHPETKKTCLWLKNLPLLKWTNNVYEQMQQLPAKDKNRIHYMSPGPDRAKLRSKTYKGIAEAMAKQYSEFIINT